jgi:hypothetical protein
MVRIVNYDTYQQIPCLYDPRFVPHVDPRLREVGEMRLTQAEAKNILRWLTNRRGSHDSLWLSVREQRACQLLWYLKDDHRSWFCHIGTTKRYQVGLAYLRLIEKNRNGCVYGTGYGEKFRQRRSYFMEYSNNIHIVRLAGSEYHGQVDTDNLAHGQGNLYWDNGDYYSGGFCHGRFHGRGKFTFHTKRQVYSGEFIQGEIGNFGRLSYPNGNCYEGEFKQATPHGNGKKVFKSGGYYSGQFERGMQHGYGFRLYPNGTSFRGYWKNDQLHGPGIKITPSGASQPVLYRLDHVFEIPYHLWERTIVANCDHSQVSLINLLQEIMPEPALADKVINEIKHFYNQLIAPNLIPIAKFNQTITRQLPEIKIGQLNYKQGLLIRNLQAGFSGDMELIDAAEVTRELYEITLKQLCNAWDEQCYRFVWGASDGYFGRIVRKEELA